MNFHIFVYFIIALARFESKNLCFPPEENNEKETCFSCAFDFFSPGNLYKQKSQSVLKSTCIQRNSTNVPIRNLLIGQLNEHNHCYLTEFQNESDCLNFFNFLKEFDGDYENLIKAFFHESVIMNEFSNSSLYLNVFGEINGFLNDEPYENIEFFRRIFIQIYIRPLDCTFSFQKQICQMYSKKAPIINLIKPKLPNIFISSLLIINGITLRFLHTQSQNNLGIVFTGRFLEIEPILDKLPYDIPEVKIMNTTIEDNPEPMEEVTFLSISKLGGSVQMNFVFLNNYCLGSLIKSENIINPVYNNEESFILINNSIAVGSYIVISECHFLNTLAFQMMYSLFLFRNFRGYILLDFIEIGNLICSDDLENLIIVELVEKDVKIQKLTISGIKVKNILKSTGTNIYLDQIYFDRSSNSIQTIILISNSFQSEIKNMLIRNITRLASINRLQMVRIESCDIFYFGNSVFYNIDGFEIKLTGGSSNFENVNFIKLNYSNFILNAVSTNITLNNCIFSDLNGTGVIIDQKGKDLIILSTKFSFINGIVIINFDDINNNIIINCEIYFVDNPKYVWARNPKFLTQTIINCSFHESNFLKLQSFYRLFSYNPLVQYKDCFFSNMNLGSFDFCCLELIFINSTFQNIYVRSDTAKLFALEQNGNYTFLNCKFYDVGWSFYSKSQLGAYNQAIIALWYPGYFILRGCEFICSKSISLRSGFIASQDLGLPILIENSIFIVRNPSLSFPVKGIIMLSVIKIDVRNCVFTNLTGDFMSMAYTHINGVISLLGSLSFFEKKRNLNQATFDNVTINNPIAVNGAAITVVSYHSLKLINCTFFNGTSVKGLGGLIAVIYVQNLDILSSNFTLSNAVSGGFLYLYDIEDSKIFYCNFSQAEAKESGGFLSVNNGNIYLLQTNIFNCKSLGIGGFVYQSKGVLKLSKVYVQDIQAQNEGAVFMMDDAETLEILESEINSVFGGGKGGLIFGEVFLTNINYVKCSNFETHSDGTILEIENFIQINLINSIFQSFKCEGFCKKGVLLAITSKISLINLENILLNQTKAVNGSFIAVYSDTKINLINLQVVAWEGGNLINMLGISSLEITVCKIKLLHCKFNDASMIYFRNSKAKILGFEIIGLKIRINLMNIAQSYAELSELYIGFDKNFISQENSNQFFFHIETSFFALKNLTCEFNPKLCSIINFLIADSEMIFENSFISSQFNDKLINAINANLTLIGISLFDNSSLFKNRGLIYIFSSPPSVILIKNSSFKNNFGTFIKATLIGILSIINSQFIGDKITENRAIHVENIKTLFIVESTFKNFSSEKGAALFVENIINLFDSEITISDCTFKDLESQNGAAFFLNSTFKLTLSNCIFIKNKAIYSSFNRISGVGAAGFIICLPKRTFTLSSCLIQIENSLFLNNFGANYSSIVFSSSKISLSSNLILPENQNTSSLDIITYPVNIEILLNSSNSSRISIHSGVAVSFLVSLVDFFGHLLRYNSFSKKIIFYTPFSNSYDSSSFARIQISTKNTSNILPIIQNGIAPCRNGLFNFKDFLVRAPSNIDIILSLNIDFNTDLTISQKKIQFDLPVFINSCEIGFVIQLDLVCLKCPVGTYSFTDPQSIKFCKRCEPNFECRGGSEVYPLAGFWRKGKYDSMAIECIIKDSCLGGNKNNMSVSELEHGACAEGHQGNLCFECVMGFGKLKSRSLCRECKDQISILETRIAIVFVILIFVIFLIIFIFSKQKTTNLKKESSVDFGFFKVIFCHFQTISIIGFMEDLSLFPYLKDFFNIQEYISLVNDDFLSLDCFFYQNSQNNILYKTIGVTILPLLASSIYLLFWIVIGLLYIRKYKVLKGNSSIITRRFLVSFVMGAYLLYPMILQSAFSLPNCIDINDGISGTKQYLYINPNIECWVDFHAIIIYLFFIPFILLWGVLFPFLLFYMFRLAKHELKKNETSAISLPNQIKKVKFSTVFSLAEYKTFRFFYDDYCDRYYYWEIVIFYKKIFLTGLSGIRNLIGADIKLILINLITIIYLVLVIKKEPFRVQKYNQYELFSGIICILFITLLSISNKLKADGVNFFGFFYISINLVFTTLIIYKAVFKLFSRKLSFLRKYFPFRRKIEIEKQTFSKKGEFKTNKLKFDIKKMNL